MPNPRTFSSKHYSKVAKLLNSQFLHCESVEEEMAVDRVIDDFAAMFEQDNSNFKTLTFHRACRKGSK